MDPASDDRPIVVAVDRSDSADDVVEWATDLATAWDAPLLLLSLSPDPSPDPPGRLAELRAAAERAGAGPVVVSVVAGAVVDQLADRSRGARMLVLAGYGEETRSGLAGAVSTALLGRVACPVTVVHRPGPLPHDGPVVVGVDGSAAGRVALRTANELATAQGSMLVVLHAWTDVTFGLDGGVRRRHEDVAALAAEAEALIENELAAVVGGATARIERRVVNDTPLRALLAMADGARALVVGRRGAARTMVGSTSRALVTFAPCPVVVAAPEAAPWPVMPLVRVTSAT